MSSKLLKIYNSKPFYKYRKEWFLLLVCFVFVMLRLPSLVEPHWYGDEGIYQVVGRAIRNGSTLYKDIWDNKPPLLYFIYAIFDGDLFAVKLASLVSGLFSVLALFYLTEKIFKNNAAKYLSTTIFAILFGLPVLEGNIANAENFMLLPTILAAFFLFSFVESKKDKFLIYSGLLLSLAFLIKIVAVFDFAAFFIFIGIILLKDKRIKEMVRPLVKFLVSFLIPIIICVLYFFVIGAGSDFVKAVFSQNISYVGYQNQFIFPMGILIIKTILLVVLLFFIFSKANKIGRKSLFIYIWLLFALYSAYFSERAYIHYLIILLPAFVLFCGNIIEISKKRIINVIIFFSILFLALFHFGIYLNTFNYYINYISFITNNKSTIAYESFFDKNTPRDYDIANFIKINESQNDKVFLWSDSAQIYALAKKLPISKYIVAYHIKFYKNADIITKEKIEKIQPRYIIQTVDDPVIRSILSSYQLRYIMDGTKIYEREI